MRKMKWLRNLRTVQRVLLIGLVICVLGDIGSLIFDYPIAPFSIVGFVLITINFVMMSRAGLNSPVPGRPDLEKKQEPRV